MHGERARGREKQEGIGVGQKRARGGGAMRLRREPGDGGDSRARSGVMLQAKRQAAGGKAEAPGGAAEREEKAAAGEAVPARAWSVLFPPDWVERAVRGSLPVLLQAADGEEIDLADGKLSAWLQGMNAGAAQGAVPLHLQRGQVGEFLQAVMGHPRLRCGTEEGGKTGRFPSGRFPRQMPVEVEQQGEEVLVRKAGAVEQVIETTGVWWWSEATGEFWSVSPDRVAEGDAQAILRACKEGRAVGLPLRRFVGQAGKLQDWLEFPGDSFLAGLRFQSAPVKDGAGAEREFGAAGCEAVRALCGSRTVSRQVSD